MAAVKTFVTGEQVKIAQGGLVELLRPVRQSQGS